MARRALDQRQPVEADHAQQRQPGRALGQPGGRRLAVVAVGARRLAGHHIDDDAAGREQRQQGNQHGEDEQAVHAALASSGLSSSTGGSGSRSPANQSTDCLTVFTSTVARPGHPAAGGIELVDGARFRIFRRDDHPAVADQFLQRRLALVDGGDDVERLLDHHQQAHRLVDLDHLLGQAGAQVRTGALHDAEVAGDVVHDLAAAAEGFVVHRREEILEVDAGADRAVDQQVPFEHLAFRVLGRIVGNQEGAAVEVGAAAHGAAAEEGAGVGDVAELGARLREVVAARPDVGQRAVLADGQRRRIEAAAAFLGMGGRGLGQRAIHLGDDGPQRRGHVLGVVPGDEVVGGVVLAGEEPRRLGHGDAALPDQRAHLGAVGHGAEQSRVGAGMAARAGAAIVGRQVRIVGAVGAVAHDHHQRREVPGQAEVGEEAGDALGLLGVGEALARLLGRRRRRRVGGVEVQPCRHRQLEAAPQRGVEAAERGRRQRAQQQRGQRDRRRQRGEQRAGGDAAARDLMEAVLPAQAARIAAAVLGRRRLGAGSRHLMHVVRGHDHRRHHRAQRGRLAVVEAVVVLEHGEVSGAAERFEPGIHFLEVAAHALLAVVHAEHQLGQRPLPVAPPAPVIGRQAGEDLLPIVALVGVEPEKTALVLVQFAQAGEQRLGAGAAQGAQLAAGDAQVLGKQEQRPRRARQAVAGGLLGAGRVAPVLDVPGQPLPSVRRARQGGVTGGRQVRFDQVEQPLGQPVATVASAVAGVAHPELGRMAGEVATQRRQVRFDAPVTAGDVRRDQAFEHQAHRQVIHHRHRHVRCAGIAGVVVAPQEHARPAGQFQRQAFEIARPALFRQAQPRQFGDHRVEGIRRARRPLAGAPRAGCRAARRCPAPCSAARRCRSRAAAPGCARAPGPGRDGRPGGAAAPAAPLRAHPRRSMP